GPMRTIIQTEADVIPISLVFIIGGVLTLPVGVYLFSQARRNTSVDAARNAA
ncbi:MFS transporter, partial [Bifidobacterium breve]|nr:MFS transporter [Bifidobacterium breve]